MISFFIHGDPAPKGSARAMMGPPRGKPCKVCKQVKRGHPIVINANDRTKGWEKAVRGAARAAMLKADPVVGAVKLDIVFFMARPKNHYVSGDKSRPLKTGIDKKGKERAPVVHTQTPDLDKLERALIDGLRDICFGDDCFVACISSLKLWGPKGGARVVIEELGLDEIRGRDEGDLLRKSGRGELVQGTGEGVHQPQLFEELGEVEKGSGGRG